MNLQKDFLDPNQEQILDEISTYLTNQSVDTLGKLRLLIERFNFDNLLNLPEDEQQATSIEFLYGMDSFSLQAVIMSENWDEIYASPHPVFTDWRDTGFHDSRSSHTPVDRSRYYHLYDSHREFGLLYPTIEELFHSWFVNLWQQAGGHRCGLRAVTVQNNSVKTFDLTCCQWEDNLSNYQAPRYGVRVVYPFPRLLSRLEIASRVQFTRMYTTDNDWYYFEQDNLFYEVGVCHKEVGQRKGKIINRANEPLYSLTEYPDARLRNQTVAGLCDKAIQTGYSQRLRPSDLPPRLTETSYRIRDINLVNCLPRFWEQDVAAFEQEFTCRLPNSYIGFLKVFNGGTTPDSRTAFPYSPTTWYTLQKLFGLGNNEVLGLTAQNRILRTKLPDHCIAIGQDIRSNYLVLHLNSTHYDQVSYWTVKISELLPLSDSFENFIDSFFDDSFIDEEQTFFAKQDNADYFRRKLSDKWSVETLDKDGHPALHYAASVNAHKVLDLLISNGASVKNLLPGWLFQADTITVGLLKTAGLTYPKTAPWAAQLLANPILSDLIEQTEIAASKSIQGLTPFRFEKNGLASQTDINALEQLIGVSLPIYYREFLLNNNGGKLVDSWLMLEPNSAFPMPVLELFGLTGSVDNDLFLRYQDLQQRAIIIYEGADLRHCLPIALTHTRAYICLCWSNNEWNIEIEKSYQYDTHWPGMTGISHATVSFKEFTDRLKSSNEFLTDVEQAILENNQDYIQEKISRGWNLNSSLRFGGYPLAFAIYQQNISFVELLINNGASVEYSSDSSNLLLCRKPLIIAVAYGTLAIIDYLLDQGAGTNKSTVNLSYNAYELAKFLINDRGRNDLCEIVPRLDKVNF